MQQIIFTISLGIILIYLVNTIVKWRKKKRYLDAGEKWDNIVDELRKRK